MTAGDVNPGFNGLIVLEGIDGSGKHTQAVLLAERLRRERGIEVRELSFPCYGKDYCRPTEMYLNGAFGEYAGGTGAYPASVFYAVDRYGSFRTDWHSDYEAGRVILTDRYTTSNMTCQAGKLSGCERAAYLGWVQEFEYGVMGLPRPGLVVYIDVPAEVSHVAMSGREKLDIHERDIGFMRRFRENGLSVAREYGWTVLDCADGPGMRSVGDINDDLFRIVDGYLFGGGTP